MSNILSSKLPSYIEERLSKYVPVELISKNVKSLSKNEKYVLKYLIKTAKIIDDIYLIQVISQI